MYKSLYCVLILFKVSSLVLKTSKFLTIATAITCPDCDNKDFKTCVVDGCSLVPNTCTWKGVASLANSFSLGQFDAACNNNKEKCRQCCIEEDVFLQIAGCKYWLYVGGVCRAIPAANAVVRMCDNVGDADCGTVGDNDCADGVGDPHITNMNGKSFDILQLGMLSFLHFTEAKTSVLKMMANIERASDVCTQTFINKIIVSGRWIEELGHSQIEVQPDVNDTVRVVVGDGRTKSSSAVSRSKDLKMLSITIHDFVIEAAGDSHWGWSFLNIRVRGMKNIKKLKKVERHGLLIDDDFTTAASAPEGCSGGDDNNKIKFHWKIVSQ